MSWFNFRKSDPKPEAKPMPGSNNRLFRINAVELSPADNGRGFLIRNRDHFTISAPDEASAIGAFKTRPGAMQWYVTSIEPETVMTI